MVQIYFINVIIPVKKIASVQLRTVAHNLCTSTFSQQISSKITQYIIQNTFEFAHLESGRTLFQIIVHYRNFNSGTKWL